MTPTDRPPAVARRARRALLEEQERRRGTEPIGSADTCALPGIWESDDEVEAFIEFTRAARH